MRLPGPKRTVYNHGARRSAGQADLCGDVVAVLGQSHVGDQQADKALALPHRSGRVGPQGGQVGDQSTDLDALVLAEGCCTLVLGTVVFVLGLGELPQLLVPVRLQGVSHQAVGSVDGQIAPPGGVGRVASPLDSLCPDAIGIGGPVGQLGGDRQGRLHSERRQLGQHELGHGGVDTGPAHVHARPRAPCDAFSLTGVVGHQAVVAAAVVVHRHPPPAAPADDQALQQGGSLAGRSRPAVLAVGGGVGGKASLVGFEGLHADVTRMCPGDEHRPVFPGLADVAVATLEVPELASSAIEVGPGIAGVVQGEQHVLMTQGHPVELACVRTGEVSSREAKSLRREGLHHRQG